MKKRVLSIGMAAVMLSAAVPVAPMMTMTAYADESIKTAGLLEYQIVDGKSITITGCDDSATEVVIPETIEGLPVTYIGDGAFVNCTKLTSVTLPDSVEAIGMSAFGNCRSLESIEFPYVLTSIGDEAFSTCTSLTSIDIPNGVTYIGMGAFSGCSELHRVLIPESVTYMGSGDTFAFNGCENLTIQGYEGSFAESCAKEHNIPFVPDPLRYLGQFQYEVVYEAGWCVKITGCDKFVTEIEIPTEIEGLPVTQIGKMAFFDCYDLRTVIIPNGVTSIGEDTFMSCRRLTSVFIPDSVTSIDKYAFFGCEGGMEDYHQFHIYGNTGSYAETYAKEQEIPFATMEETERTAGLLKYQKLGLKSVTITGCDKSVTEIEIPTEIEGLPVTAIGIDAFYGCDSLKSITIPESVKEIDYGAFANCTSLTSVILPKNFVSIAVGLDYPSAFSGCDALTSITIPDTYFDTDNEELYRRLIRGYCFAFHQNNLTSINAHEDSQILASVDGILFSKDKTKLILYPWGKQEQDYTIPDGVTSIGCWAFVGSPLRSVTIPDSVTRIDDYAFDYCENLIIYGNIGSYAESYAKEKNLPFVRIGAAPEDARDIGLMKYEIIDGKSVKIKECDRSATVARIPETIEGLPVTAIGYGAFENCTALEYVTIPETVTIIGEEAFHNCTALKYVNIPYSVEIIGPHAFGACSSLEGLTIPSTVTQIDPLAFHNSEKLTLFCYSGSAAEAVAKNSEIPYVLITTETVTPTEEKTSGLLNYVIVDDKSITITGCDKSATEVEIPAEIDGLPVTKINNSAFSRCDLLTSVTIPDSVTSIDSSAFFFCPNLTSVTIPNSVTSIGSGAFSWCPNLTSVTIPDSVIDIARNAFERCAKVVIYGSADSYAESFAKDNMIPFALIGAAAEDAKTYGQLKYVIVDGETVKITGCDKTAQFIQFPEKIEGLPVTAIGYGAFENCTKLKSVNLQNTVTLIGEEAFHNCTALTSVMIPNSLKIIGAHAFDNCSSLETLTIPAGVTQIDPLAFHGSEKLTIHCTPGSAAEEVAKNRQIPYVLIQTEGDVNEDLTINLKDVTLLRRYIAGGWDVTINQSNADINYDGSVNLKDVTLLRRRIAGGWDTITFTVNKDGLEPRADGSFLVTDEFSHELTGSLTSDAGYIIDKISLENFDYYGNSQYTATVKRESNEWKANDLGLRDGMNKLVLTVTTTEGKTYTETLTIYQMPTLDYSKQALTDLSGVSNARTLSGYINSEGRSIKENVVFRTANLSHITDRAMTLLTEKYHVTDIMDFRYERELNPNTVDKEVPGTVYHNITMSSTQQAANEAFANNPELLAQFQELQRNVGQPGGKQALTFFQAEIGFFDTERAIKYYQSDEAAEKYAEVFDIFLNKKDGEAVLFHCAGGKDRTGMVSMLLLAALDFDKDVMMQDYLMSNVANAEKIEAIKEAAEAYTDDPKLRYDIIYTEAVYPEVMSTIIDDLVKDYGSVKGFLREKVGLTDDDFAKLKEMYLN